MATSYRFILTSEEATASAAGYTEGNTSPLTGLTIVDNGCCDTASYGLTTPEQPNWITASMWPFATCGEACSASIDSRWEATGSHSSPTTVTASITL